MAGIDAPDEMNLIDKAKSGDSAAMEILLFRYSKLIQTICWKFRYGCGETSEIADLQQEARLAFVAAVTSYDSSQKVKFMTYVFARIRGQIQHYFRDNGSMIRQPAWIQEEKYRLSNIFSTFCTENHREPSYEEWADLAGLSEERLNFILRTHKLDRIETLNLPPNYYNISQDDPKKESNNPRPIPEYIEEPIEIRLDIQTAIDQLPDKDRQILLAVHFEERSKTEVALAMGITCASVGRSLARSYAKLQSLLKDYKDGL